MRVIPIAEIIAMQSGESVPAVRLKFKKVGKYSTGTNEHGQWSFQNCTAADGNGEMKVKLKNRPELTKQWEGVWVYFESVVGTKKPFLGLVREVDEYRGVNSPVLVADERAVMTQDTGQPPAATQAPAAAPAAAAPPPPVQQTPAPQPQQAAPQQPQATAQAPQAAQSAPAAQQSPKRPAGPVPGSPEDRKECIRKARVQLGQAANAMKLAFDAAIHVAIHVKEKHGLVLPATEIEKVAVSFYIALDRANMIGGLPSGQMEENKATEPKPE